MTTSSPPTPGVSPLAASLASRGVYYGWVVVAVTFLTMMVGASAVGAPSVLIGPLQAEFNWDIADISAVFGVRMALFGLVGPFAAVLLNHFGVRRVASVALILVGLGVAGSYEMTGLWQLFLLWGIVVGTGTGLTAMVLGATIATRWFLTRRGLVTGLLSASLAGGQLVFLPVFASLSESHGWRVALTLLLVMIFSTLLVVHALMRDWPADVGLRPYGAGASPAESAQSASFWTMLASPIVVLAEVSRSTTFWVLFGTFFVCGATTNGLVQTHLITICGDFGILPVTAAGMLAAIGAFNLVGTVASGWLSDRYDGRWLLFWYYGLRGLSLLYLPFTDFGFYELTLFTVFYGLDWLATVPPTVKLTADRFGSKATIVYGWVFVGHQIGAAIAAYGAGFVRGLYATYLPAFYVAGLLCMFAAVAIFAVRPPRDDLNPETA